MKKLMICLAAAALLPCAPAIDALSLEMRETVVAKPEIMAKGQVILGLESIPGAMELYAKAWDRIKATEAR